MTFLRPYTHLRMRDDNRLGGSVERPEREAEHSSGNADGDNSATAGSHQNGDGSEWYYAHGPEMFSTVPRTASPAPAPRTTPSPAPRTPSPAPRTPSPAPRTPSPAPRTPSPPPPQRGPVRPSSAPERDGRSVDVERMMGLSTTERTDRADPQLDDWNGCGSRASPFFDGPRTFHPYGNYIDGLMQPMSIITRIIDHNHRVMRMAPDGRSDDDDDDEESLDLLPYAGDDGQVPWEPEPGHRVQHMWDDDTMDGIEYEIERLNVRDVAADGPAPSGSGGGGGGGQKRSRSSDDDQDDEPCGRRVRRS